MQDSKWPATHSLLAQTLQTLKPIMDAASASIEIVLFGLKYSVVIPRIAQQLAHRFQRPASRMLLIRLSVIDTSIGTQLAGIEIPKSGQ